ncbi:MAG: hypothetical protein QOG67_1636 [Verrucomicrobiota bacterium]|jgi:hypothetical protein
MTKSSLTFGRRTLLRTSTGIVASVALPDGSRADTAAQAETSLLNGRLLSFQGRRLRGDGDFRWLRQHSAPTDFSAQRV